MFPLANYFRGNNLVRNDARFHHLRIFPLKFGEHVHAFNDSPKTSVPSIELGSGAESEEELRSSSVPPCVRHAQCTAKMPSIFRLVSFAIYLIAGPAGAVSLGITPLSHEMR